MKIHVEHQRKALFFFHNDRQFGHFKAGLRVGAVSSNKGPSTNMINDLQMCRTICRDGFHIYTCEERRYAIPLGGTGEEEVQRLHRSDIEADRRTGQVLGAQWEDYTRGAE